MAKIKSGDFRDPVSGTGNEAETLFRVRCLHRDVKAEASAGSRSRRDWREVQANKGMAALLMPRSIFIRVAVMNGAYEDSGIMIESASGKGLVDAIATAFDVSRQAAEYRLREFTYIS